MPVALVSDKYEVKQWKFPGGEVGVKLLPKENKYSFMSHRIDVTGIVTSDDFFTLFNVISALHHTGVKPENICVFMPYLPYARQDRVCHEGESHAGAVYLYLLERARDLIGRFIVSDLHSEFSQNYLKEIFGNKLLVESQFRIVHLAARVDRSIPEFDYVVAPDAGAAQKAAKISSAVGHVQLTKTRTDGKVLTSIDESQPQIVGTACIYDDICDGGATFIAAAELLKRTQPQMTSLNLYVTHGIFSQGVDKLLQVFDNIYVYNLMSADPEVAQKVKVI